MKAPLLMFLVLACVWLALSQQLAPLLLALGVLSVAFIVLLMRRLEPPAASATPGAESAETKARLRLLRLPGFWWWLAGQIIQSNIAVARAVLSPSLPISPVILHAPVEGMGDTARVIYANSITLTPGTVSVALEEDRITVHALFHEAAADLLAGEMRRRAMALQGEAREDDDR